MRRTRHFQIAVQRFARPPQTFGGDDSLRSLYRCAFTRYAHFTQEIPRRRRSSDVHHSNLGITNMRTFLALTGALALGGMISLASAKAEPAYYPGGEMQRAGMCQVTTDPFGFYGYMRPCPASAPVVHRHRKQASH